MELSKSNMIFNIIDNQAQLVTQDSNDKWCIDFKNGNSIWTESEYNNFVNVMRSSGYTQEIENEYLEVSADDKCMFINGYNNIIKYCNYNNLKNGIIWNNKNIKSIDTVDDLFNSTLDFNIKNYTPFQTPPQNWNDIRKSFKINKKIVYTDSNKTKFVVNICKSNDDTFYKFKSSRVIKSHQKYEFYIDITDTHKDNIIPSIIKMEQAIYLSNFIISKPQQKKIIDDYYNLIKNDIFVRKFNKDSNKPPLLTPKPVTLEKENMAKPDEYGSISILSEYTVTEKADGERILLYINDTGKIYLINNTYRVDYTGLEASKELYNSLIDGEYISCNSRKDNSSTGLYAAFDIYYYGGKKVTHLPLMSDKEDKESRYGYMLKTAKLIKSSNDSIDYIVKEHLYNKNGEDILENCKKILNNEKGYAYDVDGLIFTPAKLALYGYYANKPVQITDNMKWDRVFKWKPAEQNTIDFLTKDGRTLIIDGQKYKELFLYVGYNAEQWVDYTIDDAIRTRYDKEYRNAKKENKQDHKKNYVPKLFKPTIYYTNGIEKALVKINSNGDIICDDGSKIEGDSIVEFKYILDESISVSMRWKPIRVREDKTRIYNKGELSKTANDLKVAINIWRSIHNPVTKAMIIGNEKVFDDNEIIDEGERLLETDDIYYSRNIPREAMLSYHMHQFHNQGIKSMLYAKPKIKGNLVELACGQGGDMSRWFSNGYKFILGVDLVKNNIYNPRSGAYSRMLNGRNNFVKKNENSNKIEFTDMVFAVGDCSKSIITGDCSKNIIKDNNGNLVDDKDSVNLLKIIFNKKNSGEQKYYSHVAGAGLKRFDVCSCMFSTHYFFKSEETLNGFLTNVSTLLKKDGVFFCTFMDGKSVEDALNGGDIVEGKKILYETVEDKYTQPTWAIIRRFNKQHESMYNKKIDVFIESTNRFIPEYIVNFNFLVKKCKEFNLEIEETEMFGETFNKIKSEIPDMDNIKDKLHKDVMALDKDEVQKKFSFLNRWCVFKKI
jgi:hypothetical protein